VDFDPPGVAVREPSMSTMTDSQVARLLIERRLCTPTEVDIVVTERKDLATRGDARPLADLMVDHGYVTRSQIARLAQAIDDDSMYRPAQQIPGYQILSKLGQGAMAVVFKAKQLSLDRIVAIKVLPKRLSENQEFVDRFYREGRAAAKLNHPNIVAAYDVGESGGYHYFVMEYIDGQTVYDLLQDGKRVAERRAIHIILQVARALDHAHAVGLIHRDVKPKNIMLTHAGDVKLADMGLAREVDDHKTATAEAGRAYGTPYYISPEQIRGVLDIDYRADIYAVGATFYHMVTGRVPFEGANPSAVMHKHLKEPLVPPDHLVPSLSSGIGETIEVMMAKSREDRYPSMSEAIADLEAVARGEPPLQARQIYDHVLLEQLATTGENVARTDKPLPSAPRSGSVAPHWVVILGMLLVVSLFLNVILLAR
jgi:serine/threonine-protein kinase